MQVTSPGDLWRNFYGCKYINRRVWIGLENLSAGHQVNGSMSSSAINPDSCITRHIVVTVSANSNMRPIMKIASYIESKKGAVELPYGVLSIMVEKVTFTSSMETWISTSTYRSRRKCYYHLLVWHLGIILCTRMTTPGLTELAQWSLMYSS